MLGRRPKSNRAAARRRAAANTSCHWLLDGMLFGGMTLPSASTALETRSTAAASSAGVALVLLLLSPAASSVAATNSTSAEPRVPKAAHTTSSSAPSCGKEAVDNAGWMAMPAALPSTTPLCSETHLSNRLCRQPIPHLPSRLHNRLQVAARGQKGSQEGAVPGTFQHNPPRGLPPLLAHLQGLRQKEVVAWSVS